MGTASVCVLGYIELGVSNPADWRSHAQGGLATHCVDAADGLGPRYGQRLLAPSAGRPAMTTSAAPGSRRTPERKGSH